MNWLASFPMFLFSALIFLAGIFPFSLLGAGLPMVAFLWWALHSGFYRYLAGGIFVGLLFDTVSPLPFGTHSILFLVLAAHVYFIKQFLLRRYIWGEFFLVAAGMILGTCVISTAIVWEIGIHSGFFEFISAALLSVGASLLLSLFFFWLEYRDGRIPGVRYVV